MGAGTQQIAGSAATAPPPNGAHPTIWGLEPVQLHDRFWAQRGVQVVRPGERLPLSERAQLFLLTGPGALAVLEATAQFETLYWSSPELVYLRVRDSRERGYRERVITDDSNQFLRFERVYDRPVPRLMRAAFTPNRELAQLWQNSPAPHAAWRAIRRAVPREARSTLVVDGTTYDRRSDSDLARLARDLARTWDSPGSVISRARQVNRGVWADADFAPDPGARLIGPVWVGAGRRLDPQTTVIGPAVLWDEPAARPAAQEVIWPAVIRLDLPQVHKPLDSATLRAKRLQSVFKRGFDILFAIVALLLTLPLYPLVILAIWLEDRRPAFFAHKRETLGGREFPCLKFRSMYRNAEKMKQQLAGQNQADGPQFYMEKDVRVTRVGRFLRATRLDELPQFFNVLLGHMSVVGPRPSPYKENQFCPAWREARLSVRPGITGLWQIKRTRQRGQDFQEWIKYDIEYVENASFLLDMIIILKTVLIVLSGFLPLRK